LNRISYCRSHLIGGPSSEGKARCCWSRQVHPVCLCYFLLDRAATSRFAHHCVESEGRSGVCHVDDLGIFDGGGKVQAEVALDTGGGYSERVRSHSLGCVLTSNDPVLGKYGSERTLEVRDSVKVEIGDVVCYQVGGLIETAGQGTVGGVRVDEVAGDIEHRGEGVHDVYS